RTTTLPMLYHQSKATIINKALPVLIRAMKGKNNVHVPFSTLLRHLIITLLPAIVFVATMGITYKAVTAPIETVDYGLQEMGGFGGFDDDQNLYSGGLAEPEGALSLGGLAEPEGPAPAAPAAETAEEAQEEAGPPATPAPTWFWILLAVGTVIMLIFYAMFTLARLEIFKMLLSSFFPLAILIAAVLGSIVFGFATPS